MSISFKSDSQRRLFAAAITELRRLGYEGELLEEEYSFRDWFARDAPLRTIPVALFGRLPADYDTALLGIALTNGHSGTVLANQNRALGAPLILEVGEERISLWNVGVLDSETIRTEEFDVGGFCQWVRRYETQLRPGELLRSKHLKDRGPVFYENNLFAGLIPELEERIGKALDPRLTVAFRDGWETYHSTTGNEPTESSIFKVAFWLLTGKVFSDRRHPKFITLGENATADEVLSRVANHYAQTPFNLLNRQTRDAIFRHIWAHMDFRNLSVEALSQIWSRTLVTPETRKRLGIYLTRRSLVRYIVDRIPFEAFAPSERYVLEPCSGSAGFLVAAMERMQDLPDTPSVNRHAYFRKHLAGFERDPFGAEISRLCLTLADYPNRNGWDITDGPNGDVFLSSSFPAALRQARIVLCNPPFRAFSPSERSDYMAEMGTPPAELLSSILRELHPDGVIGFVLPRPFLNGKQYKAVRRELAERYAEIETLWLPDKGWQKAAPETAVLIATKPKRGEDRSTISYGRVREDDWPEFDRHQDVVLPRDVTSKSVSQATKSLAGYVLRDVWDYLEYCPTIGSIALVSKGVEWSSPVETHGHLLVRQELPPDREFRRGIPPEASPFFSFEPPPTAYLSFEKKYQRRPNSFTRPWNRPKVILNKSAKSRGPWRLAAFADHEGLACFETFVAVWPMDDDLVVPLAAVLNGPVANAFVWERSGKRECTLETIRAIRIPIFKPRDIAEITRLVQAYLSAVAANSFDKEYRSADLILREIDATILNAYGLSPRHQRQLLDFFNDDVRQVPFEFHNYFPADFEPYFKLSEWLTGRPALATVEMFRSQSRDLPEEILDTLRRAGEEGQE